MIAFLARAACCVCCCCCCFCCWSNWAAAIVVVAGVGGGAAAVVVAIDLPATAQAKPRHRLHVEAVFSVATPDRLYRTIYYFCKKPKKKKQV